MKSLKPYYRTGIGYYHHGDCYIFSKHICTCGFLHTLRVLNNASQLYSKFEEELFLNDSTLENIK